LGGAAGLIRGTPADRELKFSGWAWRRGRTEVSSAAGRSSGRVWFGCSLGVDVCTACVRCPCRPHWVPCGRPLAPPSGHARAQPTRPRRLAGGPGAHGHARRAFWAWLAGSIARVLSHLPCPVTGGGRLSRRFRLPRCAGRPARHLKRCRRAHACRYASLGVASARPKGRHRAAH